MKKFDGFKKCIFFSVKNIFDSIESKFISSLYVNLLIRHVGQTRISYDN